MILLKWLKLNVNCDLVLGLEEGLPPINNTVTNVKQYTVLS